MTDAEIIHLIDRLQKGEGTDEESSGWIDSLKTTIPCPYISDLIFYGSLSDTPETIFRKAREYRPLRL